MVSNSITEYLSYIEVERIVTMHACGPPPEPGSSNQGQDRWLTKYLNISQGTVQASSGEHAEKSGFRYCRIHPVFYLLLKVTFLKTIF